MPAVQFLPTRSLAGVEPHTLGVEPLDDLVQISRPALRLSSPESTVSGILETL